VEHIAAGVLIPGRGEPIRDGVVVFDDGVITYAGPADSAPPAQDPRIRVAAVMPGLWDCHAHLIGARSFDLGRLLVEPMALRAARCARDLQAALQAGVTSVREVGGLGVYVAQAVAEGVLPGPTVYGAGAILSPTGGHGDAHSLPLSWVTDFSRCGGDFRLCDGVDECMRATREMLRRDAKLIKVCASGGMLSELDDPIHQQFTVPELRAIVEVAAMADRVVAAHCHGKPGVMAALEAGAHTIEHGTYLDEEACDAMRETGAILVPTRTVVSEMLAHQDAAPERVRGKLPEIANRHFEAMAMAVERGVTIAMGTDILATGDDLPNSWGRNGQELGHLAAAGMNPLQAIEAATANGPRTLGPQAPNSGLLAAGYDADVITLDADPLTDLAVLADPDRITGVWVGGRQVKAASPREPGRS
jgi:imidazolonepropionase-like amidohydrolase